MKDGARIMFSRGSGQGEKKGATAKQPVEIYLQVAGVESYHDELKKRKARITDALTTQWWGDRTFKVLDPAGYSRLRGVVLRDGRRAEAAGGNQDRLGRHGPQDFRRTLQWEPSRCRSMKNWRIACVQSWRTSRILRSAGCSAVWRFSSEAICAVGSSDPISWCASGPRTLIPTRTPQAGSGEARTRRARRDERALQIAAEIWLRAETPTVRPLGRRNAQMCLSPLLRSPCDQRATSRYHLHSLRLSAAVRSVEQRDGS